MFPGPVHRRRDKVTRGGTAFHLAGTPYGSELRRRWVVIFPKPPEALPKSDGKEPSLVPTDGTAHTGAATCAPTQMNWPTVGLRRPFYDLLIEPLKKTGTVR
jgi:hypothetical protein